jgi:hypothetical protein
MEHRLGELKAAYRSGAPHRFGLAGRVGLLAGAATLAARGGRDRRAAIAAGVLINAGALSARWSIFKAGFRSAARADDTVLPQRERIRRGETAGAARRGRPGALRVDRRLASPATASPGQPG